MGWKNSTQQYGLIAIVLHWSTAILIVGLFILGVYMVGLDYYNPLYLDAPDVHRSVGMLVAGLLFIRFIWRLYNICPELPGSNWEKTIASLVHHLFYVLAFTAVISGYLISTADGKPIYVFDWFQISASITSIDRQEDVAGLIHKVSSYAIIVLTLLHVAASLKHHFVDKDHTLVRMLGLKSSEDKPL